MRSLPWLDDTHFNFPPVESALEYPNGLLAAGGDLSALRILSAYEKGIFPWFNPGEPILWWSPNPRAVLFPSELHISKSLRKRLRHHQFHITFDHCFTEVVKACALPRNYSDGTWISEQVIEGYSELHKMGKAHSVEVWELQSNQRVLVGGLYGVALGKIFFGESMFSQVHDASKIALVHLVQQLKTWDFKLIDCQVPNDHTTSLGARQIGREDFVRFLIDFTHATVDYPQQWSDVVSEVRHP